MLVKLLYLFRILLISLTIFIFSINYSSAVDVTNQLEKLSNLYEKGLITDEEFKKAKSIILQIGESQQKKVKKVKDEKEKVNKKIKEKNKQKKITKKKIEKDKNIDQITEGIKIRKYSSEYNKKNFEKMELVVGNFRFYTSRPGGIKITRISDRKQLAVIGDNQVVKYYNNGKNILDITSDKENLELLIKMNNKVVLRWKGKYVEMHRAHFYQVLAMGYKPFHYYVKLKGKSSIAMNMGRFDRKIELKLITVKEKLAQEHNISIEQIDEIIERKNLTSLGKEYEDAVTKEVDKIINETIDRSIDEQLVQQLEQTIGQALAEAIVDGIEQATNEAIDKAIENELAAVIDEVIQEAINEGISEAAITAGLAAFFEALAAGASFEDAIAAGDRACDAHGGC